MKEIGNFFARLSSRKFLLTIAGIVLVTLSPENAAAITTLIGIFVGGEGVADTVSRYAVEKTKQATGTSNPLVFDETTEDDDVITGIIEPGNAAASTTTPNNFGGDAPL